MESKLLKFLSIGAKNIHYIQLTHTVLELTAVANKFHIDARFNLNERAIKGISVEKYIIPEKPRVLM